jgi:Zn-dependent protease with chaperone function
VRYQWLRACWGERVSLRSWLAGSLVVLLALIPSLVVTALLLILLPETFGRNAIIMLGVGVIALGCVTRGGGVLLLRLLGIVRPATPQVRHMVEQLAREMKVPGSVQVFELEWAQVNAVAWVLYRAVGFSRPLLELMTPDEVRAVAAHELAHLIEPARMKAVRIFFMFAYLPAGLLIKYGGSVGIAAGYLLGVALFLCYKRFSHRLEQRADRLESEAIGDPAAYMRSLIKLHETNLTPAVMAGSPTHPHLYDRLLAGGIQPDFARPMAPKRSKPLLAAVLAVMVTTVMMFGMVVAAGVAVRLWDRLRL